MMNIKSSLALERTKMPKIELLEATSLDFEAYADFQKEAFRDLLGHSGVSDSFMTPSYYRWKYHTLAGMGRIARISESGKIISSSAMIPFLIRAGNEVFKGWQCLDVATLLQARKKGYFLSTLKTLMGSVGQKEVFFAFPNASSIPSFMKLGCLENEIIATWVSPFVFPGNRGFSNIKIVGTFSHQLDIFLKKQSCSRAPVLSRSVGYLDWRYVEHPNNKYTIFEYGQNEDIAGFAVVRKAHAMGKDIILIMELWGSHRAVEVSLLRHITVWAAEQKEKMIVMMNSSISLVSALRALFFPVPTFLLPKRQVLVVHTNASQARPTINKKWKVQTGDWDVF